MAAYDLLEGEHTSQNSIRGIAHIYGRTLLALLSGRALNLTGFDVSDEREDEIITEESCWNEGRERIADPIQEGTLAPGVWNVLPS